MKKLINLSLLTAIALVLALIETSLPIPIPIPGAKLGLANIIILSVIVLYGLKEGLTIGILRSILMILLTGSVTSFFYSFFGALISSIMMYLFYRFVKGLSLIGVSLIGAFFHNLSQVLVAGFILGNFRIVVYLPFLLFLSIFTGYFVGVASIFLTKHLKKIIGKTDRSLK